MNLEQEINQMAVAMKVEIERIAGLIKQTQELMARSAELLARCERQVGMHLGEEIQQLTSEMRGQRFDAANTTMKNL
jgi:hypothetical protein